MGFNIEDSDKDVSLVNHHIYWLNRIDNEYNPEFGDLFFSKIAYHKGITFVEPRIMYLYSRKENKSLYYLAVIDGKIKFRFKNPNKLSKKTKMWFHFDQKSSNYEWQ